MVKYTEAHWEKLRFQDLDVAIDLVIHGGWSALSVRKVGAPAGRSGSAINKRHKGTALKLEVLKTPFRQLVCALAPYEAEQPPAPAKMRGIVLDYLRKSPWVAELMLQILAQARLSHTDEAREIAQAIKDERAITVACITRIRARSDDPLALAEARPEAEDLMLWYVATCVLIAGGASVSEAARAAAILKVTPVNHE